MLDLAFQFEDSSLFGEESPRQIAEYVLLTCNGVFTPLQPRQAALSVICQRLYLMAEDEDNKTLKRRLLFHFGEYITEKVILTAEKKREIRKAYLSFYKELLNTGYLKDYLRLSMEDIQIKRGRF